MYRVVAWGLREGNTECTLRVVQEGNVMETAKAMEEVKVEELIYPRGKLVVGMRGQIKEIIKARRL